MPMMTEDEAVEAMQEVTARARGVYREGCPKCAEHGREMDAMRAKLKAAHARPTMVMRFDDDFHGGAAILAVFAVAALGVTWVVAGSVAWVGRLAVVTAVFVSILVALLWNDARVDRVLGKEQP